MNKWQKQRKRHLDNLEKQTEQEMIAYYQVALKELRGKIATLYEQTNGDWIEAQKYNRLSKLEKEIANEIGKLTGKSANSLLKSQRVMYEESYYSTAYVLSNTVKADLQFTALSNELVKKSIENPLDRVGFLQRNKDNQARLTRQLREELAQGLIQGESYGKTAKRIKKRMDIGAKKAITIAQTEGHRVRSSGTLASMERGEKLGIDIKKQWLSSGDGSTRDSHQELDGVVIDLDEDFEGENGSGSAPGMLGSASEDINCRCEMIEIVGGFEPNSKLVRGVGVTEYETYNNYKKDGIIF
ncbi:phage minor head protein [Paraliobacillus sediminis]|uniref:phage head morphogenesis protein n=1 Tax=Paraliobacillus sediminis TaxID=1885916 RepID=UPI000E3D585E|nr:phage minor head protein [Paraliobacillus sediminis]